MTRATAPKVVTLARALAAARAEAAEAERDALKKAASEGLRRNLSTLAENERIRAAAIAAHNAIASAAARDHAAVVAERDAATKQGRNAIALLLAVRSTLRQLSHRVHSGYDFNADPDGMTLRVGRVEDWTTWLAPLEANVAPDVLDTIDALKAQVAQLTGQLELRDRDAKSSAAGWVATEAENERLRAQVSEYARAFGEFGTEELRMFVSMDSLLAATAPAPAVRDHAAAEARMAELEARLRLYDGTYQCLSDEINRWKEQTHVLASQCSGLTVDVAQLREALTALTRRALWETRLLQGTSQCLTTLPGWDSDICRAKEALASTAPASNPFEDAARGRDDKGPAEATGPAAEEEANRVHD